ncbi:glycosyltransferase family A protein [Tamlana sp. 2_MG-2023]|uniref:glycosyltransferase family 2 protein n=1 Tax=unclassified Tamlana TaxID=2614803 RepID=UPI0026E3F1A2|nr:MULTISPECIES: glycosyltransferase family A protein [unclassified Tamlana]MDO6758754.1 glycosyltransferase family A protein [Tamlana sp. 2_MG-2023]MDO6789453.1 glycosyltransferase family A protein [Tamlana sp. 1_MG-2023]
MKKTKISVIITCFNYSEYVTDALESVSLQSLEDFECIIVDDGSTDNSKDVINQWIKKDARFIYYYQENSGVSSARNKAISLSQSKYILPLDADDMISGNYLEECYKIISSNINVKVVYGSSYLLNKPKKSWNLGVYNYENLLYQNMIHCSAVFKKDDWNEIGGYDINLKKGLEDWEFWINLLKKGGDVVKLDSCHFFYRIKEFSLNRTVVKDNYGYDSRLYIFNKHKNKYKALNDYDLCFENFHLKNKIRNPLIYLTTKKLFLLLLDSALLDVFSLIRRVRRKVKR